MTEQHIWQVDDEGKREDLRRMSSNLDIVSEWKENINEEELGKIAWDYIDSQNMPCRYEETSREAFKAGYRKAFEQ